MFGVCWQNQPANSLDFDDKEMCKQIKKLQDNSAAIVVNLSKNPNIQQSFTLFQTFKSNLNHNLKKKHLFEVNSLRDLNIYLRSNPQKNDKKQNGILLDANEIINRLLQACLDNLNNQTVPCA